MKLITEYTKKELLELGNFMPKETFTEIVVCPTGKKHDSGWGCMKFVLLKQNEIVGVVSGWSDVMHLPKGMYEWKIDLLPKSKCLRFWSGNECTVPTFLGSDFLVGLA